MTGAARGLGAAIARLFAAEGAAVLLTDVRDDAGKRAANQIVDHGGRGLYHHLDVTSQDDWRTSSTRCVQEFGTPNVLVLNARLWVRGTILETAIGDWDRLFGVNLRGCALGMQTVLPLMLDAGIGSIVSIGSSMGGEIAHGDGAAYQAAKAGLTALTKSVAAAYGPMGIRANAVHSGPMRTETLVEQGFAPRMEEIASKFPIPRPAHPDEIAQVALFLASDESSYITASQIVPDGGSSSVMMI